MIHYQAMAVQRATFKAGLTQPVHRWFRLTPSFGADLVRHLLTQLHCDRSDTVLDPFAGAATTLIECQQLGVSAYGFEINPFLHWIGQTSLQWTLDATALTERLQQLLSHSQQQRTRVCFDSLAEYGYHIPPIYNPLRWWRPDVLTDLLVLKAQIAQHCVMPTEADFFRLALAGVLVPELSNVTLGRLQLHFIDRSQDEINVLSCFAAHAREMIADLAKQAPARAPAQHFHTSALQPAVTFSQPINAIITSPPYPNRYSYVWNTRPHLYFFDFITTAKQAAQLDIETIGGTWGSATSRLMKGEVMPVCAAVDKVVSPLVAEIRCQDNLMANYTLNYFNGLATHLRALQPLPRANLRVAYVVGNSRLKGVYVATDELLAELFKALDLGYEDIHIERFRRRHSGRDLYESVVYARQADNAALKGVKK